MALATDGSLLTERIPVVPPRHQPHRLGPPDPFPDASLRALEETVLGPRLDAADRGDKGREESTVEVLERRIDRQLDERIDRSKFGRRGSDQGFADRLGPDRRREGAQL